MDENGNDITEDITFIVKQGEEIVNQFREIKLGEYTIKVNYNEENYKLQEGQENPVTVSLNKDNKDVEYTFKFNKVKLPPQKPAQEMGKLTVKISNFGNTADFEKFDIYLVDENHNKINTPEWKMTTESGIFGSSYMVYSTELSVDVSGTEYIVQADCNIDGKAFMLNNYEKIMLDKKGNRVYFSLGNAAPLNIKSIFTDGKEQTVNYKAEAGRSAEKGLYITDMKHLYYGKTYKISPVEVPSDYTVTHDFKEAKYDYRLKKFTDLEFKYSPKNATP